MLAALVALSACGGGPRPGQPGDAYNVRGMYVGRLLVDGEPFDAEMELSTRLDGSVRGRFTVRKPLEIEEEIEGAVIDNLLRLTVVYRSAERPKCEVRIEAILTVEPGGGTIDGPATISDCGDPLGGHMSFRR
jgi:hypothetical protein